MVQPNLIKRKLTGIGGNRYFDIPGVVYPDEVLKVKPGHCPKDGLPYTTPPKWGITTEEAAKILHCSASAARIMLRRKKVCFQLVRCATSPPVIYWKKSKVESIAAAKLPLVDEASIANLLTTEEAAKLLRVGRSTIQRAIHDKSLSPIHVRIPSPQGPRKRTFLRRDELKKWCMHLRANRQRALEESQEIVEGLEVPSR
ncbi:MAG: helix-turn-helix domain-containing protein [Akkermansia sp.]